MASNKDTPYSGYCRSSGEGDLPVLNTGHPPHCLEWLCTGSSDPRTGRGGRYYSTSPSKVFIWRSLATDGMVVSYICSVVSLLMQNIRYAQQSNARLKALNELTYSVWLSRGAALAMSLDACLLVLPMCRECLKFLRPRMLWIPLHDSQWLHRQVAYSLLFYTVIHAGSHYVKYEWTISPRR